MNSIGQLAFFSYRPQHRSLFGGALRTPFGVSPQLRGLVLGLMDVENRLHNNWQGLLSLPPLPRPQPTPPAQPGLLVSPFAENASYLAAQRAGGALEGRTSIAQRDAIPGTRYARVQDSTEWHAATARFYVDQFAAYAIGADPLTASGMADGARAASTMKPEAHLFMEVASVYKGNLLDGPSNYDNPKLKDLLLAHGLTDLANRPQVGLTDVQSIGSVAQAINQGSLTLQDVLSSGSIIDMPRYQNVIRFVQDGGYQQALARYDAESIH